jgi:hypothetical protein
MNNLEKLISWYGKGNGHSVGSLLSWADLFIFDMSDRFFETVPNFVEKYPLLYSVGQTVGKNENIKSYLAKRTVN